VKEGDYQQPPFGALGKGCAQEVPVIEKQIYSCQKGEGGKGNWRGGIEYLAIWGKGSALPHWLAIEGREVRELEDNYGEGTRKL